MNEIKGNLISLATNGEFDAIIHGCNCFCTMGKGIALDIKNEFPEAYDADKRTKKGDKNKLGTYTTAIIEKSLNVKKDFIIVNAYTQYQYWGKGRRVDYDAIRNVFTKINEQFNGKHIGIPMIGAGLAGGHWPTIKQIIEDVMVDSNVTLVIYDGKSIKSDKKIIKPTWSNSIGSNSIGSNSIRTNKTQSKITSFFQK